MPIDADEVDTHCDECGQPVRVHRTTEVHYYVERLDGQPKRRKTLKELRRDQRKVPRT